MYNYKFMDYITIMFILFFSCSIAFIDFEGRSDGESVKRIISIVKPRQLVSMQLIPFIMTCALNSALWRFPLSAENTIWKQIPCTLTQRIHTICNHISLCHFRNHGDSSVFTCCIIIWSRFYCVTKLLN